jgi:hypothetical protein
MRRLAVLILVGVLSVPAAAGCTGDTSPAGTPPSPAPAGSSLPGTGSATPSPGDPTALAGNGVPVCAAVRKLTTTQVTAFITELGRSLQASAAGDTAGAEKARRAANTAVERLAAGLRAEAARADDPRLKTALSETAAVAATLTADLGKVDDAKLDEVQRRLEQLCGP